MSWPIVFEVPALWLAALPLGLLLGLWAWRQHARGLASGRIAGLLVLRSVALALLLFLAARPMRTSQEWLGNATRPVVILLDRSESMSLKDTGASRYERALIFLRTRLLPALKSADLPVQGMVFDQAAEVVTGAGMISTKPDGKRTNLGGAIAHALNGGQKPLAVIALTDGSSNETTDDPKARGKLSQLGIPFIGVGFGNDDGVQTLSLRRVEAPSTVPPKTEFSVSAELELMNGQQSCACDLVLLRDGQSVQKKTVKLDTGSRAWVESFQLNEPSQGEHEFSVQLLAPNLTGLRCLNGEAGTSVRVVDESELRVLYLQGALTWDYKFIALALGDDPSIKLTGLTRTSRQSVFRQNVETTTELANGFPASLEELAAFRVIVLSNLRPEDLSLEQQELLGRFCGEFGGGVLMLGGAATFDQSWENSKLEKLLPVVFSKEQSDRGTERDFHLELTPEALQNPLFRVEEDRPVKEIWAGLPAFSQFGQVDSAKRGAQVWLVHPSQSGEVGRRILMASQRYGAGQSAVLCLQNFWRWRLAKESDPQQFDRFWRQLFRWLGQAGRSNISIQFADQELRPGREIEVFLERKAGALEGETNRQFLLEVQDRGKHIVYTEGIELPPSQRVSCRFRAQQPDLYTVNVANSARAVIATRPVEIREIDLELERTARNMDALNQWAAVSDGLAFKVEECPQTTDLVARIKEKVEDVRRSQQVRRALGLNGWTLGVILAALSGEWLLRKRWELI
jgi:uncharacterized membrane protein